MREPLHNLRVAIGAIWLPLLGAIAILLALVATGHGMPAPEPLDQNALMDARIGAYERRAEPLMGHASQVDRTYWRDVLPIEDALLRTGRVREPALARVAAWSVVLEAERRNLSPALVAAVLQVENPWLVRDTVSFAGAVGWMQIMPQHVTEGHPCGTDLTNGPVNVCYGSAILRAYIGEALDMALRDALNRYGGCVRTPGCERYATNVLARMQ